MKREFNFWELSVFVIICTICCILLFYFIGIFMFNQQTNDTNLQLRIRLVDLMNTLANQAIIIAAAVIYAKYKVHGAEKVPEEKTTEKK